MSRGRRFRSWLARIRNARLLALGYGLLILAGFLLLCIPFAAERPAAALDHLFLAVSAVSTTGLMSIDPGSHYSFFGQLVLFLLIQVGGLGYMAFGSFLLVAIGNRVSRRGEELTRAEFSLPDDWSFAAFVRQAVVFSIVCQLFGAVALYLVFRAAELDGALWLAFFHSASAFCTAGISLFPDSFEGFRDHVGLNATLSALSILGAVGFLVWLDFWQNLTGRRRSISFTARIILRVTLFMLIGGTALALVLGPAQPELAPWQRLQAAFFQVMSASTTVGFNTVALDSLAPAILFGLCLLMMVGASPAGTGGGIKTTTVAICLGVMRSSLRGDEEAILFHREIPAEKVRLAHATFIFYCLLLSLSCLLLLALHPEAPGALVFEAVSALGTVGLSLGITSELGPLAKWVLIFLMFAGRVGILTFGLALARGPEEEEGESDVAL